MTRAEREAVRRLDDYKARMREIAEGKGVLAGEELAQAQRDVIAINGALLAVETGDGTLAPSIGLLMGGLGDDTKLLGELLTMVTESPESLVIAMKEHMGLRSMVEAALKKEAA